LWKACFLCSKAAFPWEMLPNAFGCCGMTCWRRLCDWQQAGAWGRLHQLFLQRLHKVGRLDWKPASIDSASIAAKKGGLRPVRVPSTAARLAPRRHVPAERHSTPLAALVSAANVNDCQMLEKR